MPAPRTSPHHDWPLTHVIRLPGNPRFLVIGFYDGVRLGRSSHSIFPRLAHFASNFAGTVFGLEVIEVHGRAGNFLARDRFAPRCVFRHAAFGAHGAALVAAICCRAADSPRLAASAAVTRAAKEIRARRRGTVFNLAGFQTGWAQAY